MGRELKYSSVVDSKDISFNFIFRSFMDTGISGVKHPLTGQDISVQDAIMGGVLDIPRAAYNESGPPGPGQDVNMNNSKSGLTNGHGAMLRGQGQGKGQGREGDIGSQGQDSLGRRGFRNSPGGRGGFEDPALINGHAELYGEGDGEGEIEMDNENMNSSIPISEAAAQEKVSPKVAKKIYGAMSKMALGEALSQSQIDPVSGKFIHPDTKQKMSIADAIEQGLLDPNTIFFVDPETGNVTSLGAAIADGKFNPVTGKFKDPATGLEVSLNSAIKKGIIKPDIHPDSFVEEKCPLKELLDNGKVVPSAATFVTPDGQEMSLKDALAEGFITPDSVIRMDPKTGHISAAGEVGDVVKVGISLFETVQTNILDYMHFCKNIH